MYRAVSKNTLVAFVGGVYCALLKSGGLGGFMGMGTPFSFLRFFYFLILSCFSSFNSYLRGCIGICLVEDVGNLFYIH